MARAVICDMDGLLVDTEGTHFKGYSAALSQLGISITKEFYYDFWIMQGKGIADFIRENDLDFKPEEVRAKKRQIYQDLIRKELIIYNGVIEKLEELSKVYPLALVTAAYRSDAELILELSGMEKYFELIITGTDVMKQKPNPEGLLIAHYLWTDIWGGKRKFSPQDIVMIGDAEKDVIAAEKAGMKSIAIPNKYTQDNDFSDADAVVRCISDVSQELINSL